MEGNKTVLCVQYSGPLELSCDTLEKAGYRVLKATTREDGRQLFHSQIVDAVVIDHWLGGNKGLLLAEELKVINRKVPIIIVSDFRPISDEFAGRADKWLIASQTKPDDLLRAVEDVLKGTAT